jgi:hypothetical protein
MPSDSLVTWQTERMIRLQNIEADCLHLEAMHTATPDRVQEYVRAYGVLLSSEFQGFCRDLHSECSEIIVSTVVPLALRAALRVQCYHGRKLDMGNPNPGNIGADFNRFNLVFWSAVLALDPVGHTARRDQLTRLNVWRNAISHHDYDPIVLGGSTMLTIGQVRDW